MKLALSPLHVAIGAVTFALTVGGLGCNTRTSIGEVHDGGSDAPIGDGAIGRGSGGVTGSGGGFGTAGVIGTTGEGGLTGEGGEHAVGGRGAEPGGRSGGGGAVGAGGQTGAGAAGGAMGCQSFMPPTGEAGHYGASCYQLTYAASGFYGDNILANECSRFTSGIDYELGVDNSSFTTVQVTMTSLSIGGTRTGQGGAAGVPVLTPGWFVDADGDWRTKGFDPDTQQQVFQTRPLENNQTDIMFQGTGTARIDIFDCDATTPSRSKTISWGP